MKRCLGLVVIMGLLVSASAAQDADPQPALPTAGVALAPLLPLDPAFREMSGDELFARLLEHDRARTANLQAYSALRTYSVANDKGKVAAQEIVRVSYHAPESKVLVVESESGSALVRSLVLDRLVQTEKETASGRTHRDSSIRPENYTLKPIGEQDVGPYHCVLALATPTRRDKYLFEGRIWISTDDYGIVRMAGHPAKSLSFWITRADFARQYQRIDDFWLPAEDETFAQIRLYGRKILTVKYQDYQVTGGTGHQTDTPETKSP